MQQQIPLPIIDRSRCDGCGLCVKACPHGALVMRGGKPVIVEPDVCDYDGIADLRFRKDYRDPMWYVMCEISQHTLGGVPCKTITS